MCRTRRSGFTLIELLIIVVIIGILAAMGGAQIPGDEGKAGYATMKSDLRNITTAEEAFFYDHAVYSDQLDSINFSPSRGNSITITEATATGWSATSTNPASYLHMCAMFIGAGSPVTPATSPGVVACQ